MHETADAVSHPTPERVFRLLTGYQASAMLKTAIDVGLFGAARDGATAAAIAGSCGTDARATRMLCDALTVLGLLAKDGDRYLPAPDAAVFLDPRSPAYLGDSARFLLAPEFRGRWEDLTAILRRGGPPDEGTLAPEHPLWVDFARGMAGTMAYPAELLARHVVAGGAPRRVLDIAAGHGLYGIAVARHAPEARVTAVDWPQVLDVVRENAAAAGIADRVSCLAGSAFDVPLGEGWDVVLLANFLHHFDAGTCETLLRRVHAALAPGGRAVTLEFIPDEGRATPPGAVLFAMNMLVSTPRGDAYTFAEYRAMHAAAGFSRCELAGLPPIDERVVTAWKD